jgi:hypothetical protein
MTKKKSIYKKKIYKFFKSIEKFSGADCCPSTFCSGVIIILYIVID